MEGPVVLLLVMSAIEGRAKSGKFLVYVGCCWLLVMFTTEGRAEFARRLVYAA